MLKTGVIDNPNEIKHDDKIIVLMGRSGSGKSAFVDAFTKSTDWAGTTLKSVTEEIRAIRFQLFNENIVLIDTPGFDNTHTDVTVLELIRKWLQNTYEKDIKLTGILYMNRITDNRMDSLPLRNLNRFDHLCGDNAAQMVIFVTTMWDKIVSDRGEQRERELCNHSWRPMFDLGARTARFYYGDERCVEEIIRMLLNSHSEATLMQEEVVDKNQPIVETSAAQSLYGQMQTLLSQHKETLAEMQEAAKRTNNPELLASLENEKNRVQAELDKTFTEGGRREIPLSRRITLFFSPKSKARAVDFTSGHS